MVYRALKHIILECTTVNIKGSILHLLLMYFNRCLSKLSAFKGTKYFTVTQLNMINLIAGVFPIDLLPCFTCILSFTGKNKKLVFNYCTLEHEISCLMTHKKKILIQTNHFIMVTAFTGLLCLTFSRTFCFTYTMP